MVAAPDLRCAYLAPGLEALAAQGLDLAAVLHRAGLPAQGLVHPERRVSLAQVEALRQALMRASSRDDLAFELGFRVPVQAHRAEGIGVVLPCHNLDQAARLACRHAREVYGIAPMSYRRNTRVGVFHVEPLPAGAAPALRRFFDEFGAVMLVSQCMRLFRGALMPFDVCIGQAPPPHLGRYEELAPARFRFDALAAGVTLTLPALMLDRPIPSSPYVPRTASRDSWSMRVLALLRQAGGAMPPIDGVALQLGVSSRTLDRHLARECVTFRALSRAVLVERAQALLLDPASSISEVALALGFSDPANFTRAFRRATGMVPSEFRAVRRSGETQPLSGSAPR